MAKTRADLLAIDGRKQLRLAVQSFPPLAGAFFFSVLYVSLYFAASPSPSAHLSREKEVEGAAENGIRARKKLKPAERTEKGGSRRGESLKRKRKKTKWDTTTSVNDATRWEGEKGVNDESRWTFTSSVFACILSVC